MEQKAQMKCHHSPEQKARHGQQVARWYRNNKDWVNPKRNATRRERYRTDDVYRERLKAQALARKHGFLKAA